MLTGTGTNEVGRRIIDLLSFMDEVPPCHPGVGDE